MELAYLFDPNKQFQDRNGVNNVAGFLRVYYEGTDDRATTYKNFIGTLNPADIPIDNDGRAVVIVEGEKTYRLEVYARNGNLLWTQHPLCPLVGGGGSFEQVQSNWDEEDPTSAAFIKNKPDIDNGRIHRLRPARDEVIGETSNYDGWVLDLESPNESAPGGYDRLTPQRLKQILDNGEFLVLETYQSGDYVPLALQALVTVQNENPLQISVDFVRQYESYNLLGFERMQIYTPSGEESYLQIRGLGPRSIWWQDKEALAINGDGKDVTVTFSEASARTNISTGEKLSVLFGKIKKFFTDLASVAFSGSYNDLSDKPTIPAAQVNSDWNAQSGVEQILNKPNLATVATSGSYNDLSDTQILVAKYGETTYGQVSQFAHYVGKTVVCTQYVLAAVLIDEDGYSFTFATPPNAKGQYHVFTLKNDNSWTDKIIERTHDLICQLKPIVVSGSTVMRYILCDRQSYTIENNAYVFQPVDLFKLATWINRGDVIQIDGAVATDPWGDRYPMQITEMQCSLDSGTNKLYCTNIGVRGYAYSQTEITRWGDTIVDEATNTRYLEFTNWT